jgi:predicted RNase H-like nuclease
LLRSDPSLQKRIREIHPEVSLYHLAGMKPAKYAKRTSAGMTERAQLLQPYYGCWLPILFDELIEKGKPLVEKDDILDAFAALWSAERILNGTSQTIPILPQIDSAGLRMEIVA